MYRWRISLKWASWKHYQSLYVHKYVHTNTFKRIQRHACMYAFVRCKVFTDPSNQKLDAFLSVFRYCSFETAFHQMSVLYSRHTIGTSAHNRVDTLDMLCPDRIWEAILHHPITITVWSNVPMAGIWYYLCVPILLSYMTLTMWLILSGLFNHSLHGSITNDILSEFSNYFTNDFAISTVSF